MKLRSLIVMAALTVFMTPISLIQAETIPTYTDRETGVTYTDVETVSCGLFGMFTCVDDTRFTTREGTQFESGTVLTDFATVDSDGNPVTRRTTGTTVNPATDSVADYIVKIGVFINVALLPLLFGIALLVFLFNVFRYFINRENVEERENAQRVAIYGIAAFVFLVSLWGIVNLFVSGLGFDQEESICPDYLGNWCKSRSYSGTYGTNSYNPNLGNRVPTGSYEGTPALLDYGCGSGVDVQDCPVQTAGLAELLYGSYQDGARATQNGDSIPRAANNTVTISKSTSCVQGVQTLLQSAGIEGNQAAYLYVEGGTDTGWYNVTDQTSQNSITVDIDTITDVLATAGNNTRALLIHTHSEQRSQAADLKMDGYGPSAADYRLMCDTALSDVTFAVADWNQIWQYSQNAALSCPRSRDQEDRLERIDALFAVSKIAAGDRNEQFDLLVRSDLIGQTQINLFTPFIGTKFDSQNSASIRSLAGTDLADVGITSIETSPTSLCSNF